MSPTSKSEYLNQIKKRYHTVSKLEKGTILNEFCCICGYNRKYAIQLLNSKKPPKNVNKKSKRGRKRIYNDPLIMKVLTDIWKKTNLPCSKKLKAIIYIWLPFYEFELPDDVYNALMTISPATIDRMMAPYRNRYAKLGLATTKPGSLLKERIPIKTNQWDESIPGFIEADTVAHCGTSIAKTFVYTINCVDIATSWTEQRAVWGKGEQGVIQQIKKIEDHLPFPLRGFDCDNGSEFLNWHLLRHFHQRKRPVQFTRSRPYHKNDNAHVEEKNWSLIRNYLGYQRFDMPNIVVLLNDLYANEWNDLFNFFHPSMKLIQKYRQGSKIIKKYSKPMTPYQRILQSEYIDPKTKARLQKYYKILNPFELQQRVMSKIKNILKLANQNSNALV
jgi:hypothetical protein